jgi:ABC-type Fe3+ transport system substrate-binding protein
MLLKPEWRGKKIAIDLRPTNISPLVAAWGVDKTVDYARKLAAQEPLWGRGQTNALTKLAAGDIGMLAFANYNSSTRAQTRAPGDMELLVIEPIPMRFSETLGVFKSSKRQHAALLFLEYMASAEVQQIMDEVEFKASLFYPGGRLQKLSEGKQVSIADYTHFEKMEGYMGKIVEAFGFPKADLN